MCVALTGQTLVHVPAAAQRTTVVATRAAQQRVSATANSKHSSAHARTSTDASHKLLQHQWHAHASLQHRSHCGCAYLVRSGPAALLMTAWLCIHCTITLLLVSSTVERDNNEAACGVWHRLLDRQCNTSHTQANKCGTLTAVALVTKPKHSTRGDRSESHFTLNSTGMHQQKTHQNGATNTPDQTIATQKR